MERSDVSINSTVSIDGDASGSVNGIAPASQTSRGRYAVGGGGGGSGTTGVVVAAAALLLQSLITVGIYYCYDLPGSVEVSIKEHYNVSTSSYALLYVVYAIPNMVLPLLGGYVLDALLGLDVGTLTVAGVSALGQLIFAYSGTTGLFWLALVGRFVFGIGGETVSVAQCAYATKWFAPSGNLAFAFGVNIALSRLASVLTFVVTPTVTASSSLPSALYLGFAAAFFSVTAALYLVWIDRRYYPAHARRIAASSTSNTAEKHTTGGGGGGDADTTAIDGSADESTPLLFGDSQLSDSAESVEALSASESEIADASATASTSTATQAAGSGDMTPAGRLSDVRLFPASLWLVYAATLLFYGSSLVFLQLGSDYLQTEYGLSETDAGSLLSIPSIASGIGSPFAGVLLDRTGGAVVWMGTASALLASVHVLFWLTSSVSALALMVGLGVAYMVFVTSVWTCCAYLVPQHVVATAYGIQFAVFNAGMGAWVWAIGLIQQYYGDGAMMIAFTCTAVASTLVCVAAGIMDATRGERQLVGRPKVC